MTRIRFGLCLCAAASALAVGALRASAAPAGNARLQTSNEPEGSWTEEALAALAARAPLASTTSRATTFGPPRETALGTLRAGARDASVVGVPAGDGHAHDAPTDTTTLNADEDSFTSSENPDQNYGHDSRLNVGQRSGYGATRTWVYWDLKKLPRNQVVLGGDINLYESGAGPSGDPGRDVPVKRVKGSWTETSIKWSNQPSVDDTRQDTVNMGTSKTWRTWSIDNMAVRWWDGRWTNQGAFFQGYEADGSYRQFDSREGSNEPELKLDVAIDTVPPVSSMLPMSQYTNTNPLLLRWTGQDPAPGTGIAFFTIWAKRNNEAWQVISDALTGTAAQFQGENGKQYGFRTQAVDYAGNVESPPETPQATTLLDTSPPVTAVSPLPPYSSADITLNWASQDYPQGAGLQNSGIQHYDVQISIADGPWGDLLLGTQNTSLQWTGDNGVPYAFRVRAVDRALNIESYVGETRTVVDSYPPTTSFGPASGIDSPTFTVRWSGDDHGGSGVKSYDVQFQVDDGVWQDWVTNTAETSRDFSGELGHYYGFRARATDNVGNSGAYPAQRQLLVAVLDSSTLTNHVWLPWTSPGAKAE